MPLLSPTGARLLPAPAGARTLGDLRSVLLSRLGMGGMGASGGANTPLIDSFLFEAQKYLYWMQDWKRLTGYEEISTGIGQNLYDYPEGCVHEQRILRVEINYAGQWSKVREGITTEMWSTMDTLSVPARYERYGQLLLYPKSNQAYTLRIWYVCDLGAFAANGDLATIDDSMILLHATATAKAHYRQPDAKLYEGQLEQLLARIRGQSFGSNGVYQRSDSTPIERKPAVVGRDV